MNFDFIRPNCLPQNSSINSSGKDCAQFSEINRREKATTIFSVKLNGLLANRNEKLQDSEHCQMTGQITDFDTSLESLAKDMENAEGKQFINKLKSYLAMSGKNPDTTTITGKGLQALEALLVKAGFAKDEIKDLEAELQLKFPDGKIHLSDLFDGLSELKTGKIDSTKEDKDKNDESGLLATSALPFIESIMTALGLPEEISGKILSDAEEEGRGINLDTLIAGLQKLNKKSFFSGTIYKTDSKNNSFSRISGQTGFEQYTRKLTLNDVVTAFEQMRNNRKNAVPDALITGQHGSSETDELLGGLMAGLNSGSGDTLKSSVKDIHKSEQDVSGLYMKKGFFKELDSVFSLQSGQESAGGQPVSIDGSAESDFSRLIDKVANFVSNDGKDYEVLDGTPKNGAVTFEKTNKKMAVKAINSGDSSSGAFNEFESPGRSMGLSKGKSSTGSLPAHVTNQVARSLVRAVYRGDSELRLQLKPPELGRLIVKIDNLGDSMKVSIITDNHAAKNILSSHENGLKAALAGSGISIESFDVSMGSNFSQSMANAGNHSGQGSKNSKQSALNENVSEERVSHGINAENFSGNDGALHFVA